MNEEKREALRKEFSALLDNELDPETRATIEAELAEDAELLRELNALKQLDALYRDLPKHDAPADFEAQVRARLESNIVPFSPFQKAMRWATPVVAMAATLLIVSAIYFSVSSNLPSGEFEITKAPDAQEKAVDQPAEIATESAPAAEAPEPVVAPGRAAHDELDDAAALRNNNEGAGMAMRAEKPAAKMLSDESGAGEKKTVGEELKRDDETFDGREFAASPPPMPEEEEPVMKQSLPLAEPQPTNIAPAPRTLMPGEAAEESLDADLDESRETAQMLDRNQIAKETPESPVEIGANALMKDGTKGERNRRQTIEVPMERFRQLQEYREKTAEIRTRIEIEDAQIAGGKQFNLEQGVWVESHYDQQAPVYVEKGSDDFNALLENHNGLLEIADQGEFVLTELEGNWYFIYDLSVEVE